MIALIAIVCIHYLVSGVILKSIDISPGEVGDIKIWKAFILGGFLLVFHWFMCFLTGKLSVSTGNWSLREWIER